MVLHSQEAARAFFDALACPKGPTFGTNFTLACPYAVLAHYEEQEWALELGVPLYLIRIGIGLEDPDWVRELFDIALAAIPDEPQATE